MSKAAWNDLPDEAALWVFAFDRSLSASQREFVERRLDEFLGRWMSHSSPVQGAFQILDDRFVLIAGHCDDGLSGCSRDSCMSNFKDFKTTLGRDALNRSLVFYRDHGGQVEGIDRAGFQDKLARGEVDEGTTVFDTTLQNLGQFRQGRLERPFAQCWHAQAFRLPVG